MAIPAPIPKKKESLVFHCDIDGQLKEFHTAHEPNEWRVFIQGTAEFDRQIQRNIVGSMGTVNHHRAWGRKPSLVGIIRKNSYEGCDVDWNEEKQ
ncbi:hypothetical protein TNCV_516291 [Trichonephila clavipes]|nr:hypothetical protein TNCV_516291 [Trichonephila clavipes]